MRHPIEYTRAERFWLAVLGVFGFLGVNGAFTYGLLFQPDALSAGPVKPTGCRVHRGGVGAGRGVRIFLRAVGGKPAWMGVVRVPVAAGQYGIGYPDRAAVPPAGRG
jgi:hypothetical protein